MTGQIATYFPSILVEAPGVLLGNPIVDTPQDMSPDGKRGYDEILPYKYSYDGYF